MLHTKLSFKAIGLLVSEKTFKYFTIYGHGCHLGHVTKKKKKKKKKQTKKHLN